MLAASATAGGSLGGAEAKKIITERWTVPEEIRKRRRALV